MQAAFEGARRGAPPAELVSEEMGSEALLTHVAHWLDEAKAELQEAFEDMKKVEILDDRERASERAAEAARDQATMDAIGLRSRA